MTATPLTACRFDQRFSYCLYVPKRYHTLLVTVHGTERAAQAYRDAFANFADAYECLVLAPLFPAGVIESDDIDNYKLIKFHDIRFDHVLLEMIREVEALYHIQTARFLLHGFSGGGHFAHRFFYLYPQCLLGVSIGAPGSITLLDTQRDWWVGVRNIEAIFGIPLDYPALQTVPVQMVIGAMDTESAVMPATDHRWMVGANDTGENRQARLHALRNSFERAGIKVRYDCVERIGHDGLALLNPVKEFFAILTNRQLE